MPSHRKFDGPCPTHPKKKAGCRHCNAYYMQRRYYGGNEPPPEKKYEVIVPRRPHHDVVVYRGLHWPAPTPTEFT